MTKLLDCRADVRTIDYIYLNMLTNSLQLWASPTMRVGIKIPPFVALYGAGKSFGRDLINGFATYVAMNQAVGIFVY